MEKMNAKDIFTQIFNVIFNILVVIGVLTIVAGVIAAMVFYPAQFGACVVGAFLFCCVILAICWIVMW